MKRKVVIITRILWCCIKLLLTFVLGFFIQELYQGS